MKEETKKLFKVILRGFSGGTGPDYTKSYVVAYNSDEAYRKVREFLDEKDLMFSDGRELERVELIAEDVEHPDCGTLLFTN